MRQKEERMDTAGHEGAVGAKERSTVPTEAAGKRKEEGYGGLRPRWSPPQPS
jgi:hypothetical protein